ncbi:MAG: hypothetical protein HYU88_03730, partial [Chloroflexi bacterium]|nr:hypothetical protein [Chloroflexota bacterium]
EQMSTWIQSGQPDEFGVKPLGIFMGTTGQGWCLSEAPNADAVCRAHEAKGVPLPRGDVHEVMTLP